MDDEAKTQLKTDLHKTENFTVVFGLVFTRIFAMVILSVYPSVCLSVRPGDTSRYRLETK